MASLSEYVETTLHKEKEASWSPEQSKFYLNLKEKWQENKKTKEDACFFLHNFDNRH